MRPPHVSVNSHGANYLPVLTAQALVTEVKPYFLLAPIYPMGTALRRNKFPTPMLPHRDAMQITDIVTSSQLTEGQVLSFKPVKHFRFKLIRISTTLPIKPSSAMMLICPYPSPDKALRDVVLGGEDFVYPLSR